MIFETERLTISTILDKDKAHFIELVTNPDIAGNIPQVPFPTEKINKVFSIALNSYTHMPETEQSIWGVFEKGETELIGLCAILTNDENQPELGYRFRPPYWGKGYGTEVAKGTINYVFNDLNLPLITADVWIENQASVKILNKFLTPVRDFYNENDQCWDRRFLLTKEE